MLLGIMSDKRKADKIVEHMNSTAYIRQKVMAEAISKKVSRDLYERYKSSLMARYEELADDAILISVNEYYVNRVKAEGQSFGHSDDLQEIIDEMYNFVSIKVMSFLLTSDDMLAEHSLQMMDDSIIQEHVDSQINGFIGESMSSLDFHEVVSELKPKLLRYHQEELTRIENGTKSSLAAIMADSWKQNCTNDVLIMLVEYVQPKIRQRIESLAGQGPNPDNAGAVTVEYNRAYKDIMMRAYRSTLENAMSELKSNLIILKETGVINDSYQAELSTSSADSSILDSYQHEILPLLQPESAGPLIMNKGADLKVNHLKLYGYITGHADALTDGGLDAIQDVINSVVESEFPYVQSLQSFMKHITEWISNQ